MSLRLLLALMFTGCLVCIAPAQGPSKEPKVYEITGDQKPGEFADVEAWINSKPLTFKQLKGKVVVVHFFAYACINCQRNFDKYKKWEEHFKDKDVVLIGIHTPELESEKKLENVKKKVQDAGFTHAIAVDGKTTMWNKFNNHWWPAIYAIDKKGVARCYWYGELNLYGVDGEKLMRERIEKLLAEK